MKEKFCYLRSVWYNGWQFLLLVPGNDRADGLLFAVGSTQKYKRSNGGCGDNAGCRLISITCRLWVIESVSTPAMSRVPFAVLYTRFIPIVVDRYVLATAVIVRHSRQLPRMHGTAM